MSEPFLKIPEPSLPEHNLLREAGTLPHLSSGLRDRVALNVHKQVRYGRWATDAGPIVRESSAALLPHVCWYVLSGITAGQVRPFQRLIRRRRIRFSTTHLYIRRMSALAWNLIKQRRMQKQMLTEIRFRRVAHRFAARTFRKCVT
jgi:hypothetical protein